MGIWQSTTVYFIESNGDTHEYCVVGDYRSG